MIEGQRRPGPPIVLAIGLACKLFAEGTVPRRVIESASKRLHFTEKGDRVERQLEEARLPLRDSEHKAAISIPVVYRRIAERELNEGFVRSEDFFRASSTVAGSGFATDANAGKIARERLAYFGDAPGDGVLVAAHS